MYAKICSCCGDLVFRFTLTGPGFKMLTLIATALSRDTVSLTTISLLKNIPVKTKITRTLLLKEKLKCFSVCRSNQFVFPQLNWGGDWDFRKNGCINSNLCHQQFHSCLKADFEEVRSTSLWWFVPFKRLLGGVVIICNVSVGSSWSPWWRRPSRERWSQGKHSRTLWLLT